MKNGKQMIRQLNEQKQTLIQQLKNLNQDREAQKINSEDYETKKREIERALVEIMDRLTQMKFILK